MRMTGAGLIILILFLISIPKILGDSSIEIQRILPAYAIAANFDDLHKESPCRRDLETFKKSVDTRKVWSLRMLDASGQLKPGFIHGNGFWLGIENQCYEVMNTEPLSLHPVRLRNNTLHRKPEEEFAPFPLQYFSAHFAHSSTVQYQHGFIIEGFITLGLCLPASCSTDELSLMLKKIADERTLSINSLYGIDLTLLNVVDLKSDYHLLINWRSITLMLIITSTLLMIVAGTWYDLYIHQKQSMKKGLAEKKNNEKNIQGEGEDGGITAGSVLVSFSVYTNSRNIFDLSSSGGPTGCLHGLRVTGMFLLILLHTLFFSVDHIDNMTNVLRLTDEFSLQIISNGTFPVDTFFFMSGFLAAYVFLRSDRKHSAGGFSFRDFFKALIKRYLRLTPIYMVIMGIWEIVGAYFAQTSQFQRYEKGHEQCPKYWWRNLLYIHNFFSYKELCASWTWYLSNDMQFFIVATVVLLISTKYSRAAVVIVIAMIISSITITGYSAYNYNYVPTLDEFVSTLEILYFPPWARIGPYLVGLATAYMIVKMNDKLSFNKKTVWFFWIVSVISLSLVQFGLYEKRISVLSASIYAALSKTVWSLGIAWIVVACYTNNAGVVSNILGSKLWLPLSKLTYGAYLLNPIIIVSVNSFTESPVHVNVLSMGVVFIGYVVLSYIGSFVMSLMFEVPIILLTKLYFEQRKEK